MDLLLGVMTVTAPDPGEPLALPTGGGAVSLEAGAYDELLLPRDVTGPMLILGHGAVVAGISREMSSQSECVTLMGTCERWTFDGFTFYGDVVIHGARQLAFKNCRWESGGLEVRFGLFTRLENCSFGANAGSCTLSIGNWSGASTSNSQSNCSTLTGCRFFQAGDVDQLIVENVQGTIIEQCSFEGGGPRNCIVFDGGENTTVKSLTLRNPYFETDVTGAGIVLRNMAGRVDVYGLMAHRPKTNLFEMDNGRLTDLNLIDLDYWPHYAKIHSPIIDGLSQGPRVLGIWRNARVTDGYAFDDPWSNVWWSEGLPTYITKNGVNIPL